MISRNTAERLEERCDCGHFRSEHGPLQLGCGDKPYRRDGYGRCAHFGCSCRSFHWLHSVRLAVGVGAALDQTWRQAAGIEQVL